MKKVLCILSFLLISNVIPAQEEQIPFDKEGKIQIIDVKLNEKIGYFNAYSGFREALLFAVNDSTYLLEVTYQPGNKTLRDRKQITGKELEELRLRIEESIKQKAPEYTLEQEGRTTLIVASTTGSFTYYGPALISALDLSDRPALATYMFTVGAGFAIPFYLTKKEPVTIASAYLSIYGETRGSIHGVSIASLLDLNDRGYYGASLITSVTEGYLGYRYASINKLNAGESFAMQMYGDLFSGVGLLTSGALGLYDKGDVGKTLAATYLISNGTGLIAGKYISSFTHYETGDGFYLLCTTSLSSLTGITFMDYFDPNDAKIYAGTAAASALVGMYWGNSISRDNDYSFGEGILTGLGTTAGSLIGLGTCIILTNNYDNSKIMLSSLTIGGWTGFLGMKALFDNNHVKASKNLSYHFSVGTLPILNLHNSNKLELAPKRYIPSLNFNVRF